MLPSLLHAKHSSWIDSSEIKAHNKKTRDGAKAMAGAASPPQREWKSILWPINTKCKLLQLNNLAPLFRNLAPLSGKCWRLPWKMRLYACETHMHGLRKASCKKESNFGWTWNYFSHRQMCKTYLKKIDQSDGSLDSLPSHFNSDSYLHSCSQNCGLSIQNQIRQSQYESYIRPRRSFPFLIHT